MKPTIKPLGIGDLKVVKQKLVRYEPGEISRIENIMARENRSRKHRRLQQLETIVELEQERIEESVRDLQSTERFEMENESKQTIRSETSAQAGVDISGGYGPVRMTAYAKFATNNAKEESNSNSTKYAKDVTDKTLSRLVERVRELRRTRTLEEIEETNEHGFDNRDSGAEHISGIYRWVDKYYRAKVVNYGKRLMYEFFVPEPAAFYIFATRYNLDTHVLPIKPEAPVNPNDTSQALSPKDIDLDNYLTLVQQYNAEEVQPPPPANIVISKAINCENPNGDFWSSNEELKIPNGYTAVQGHYFGYSTGKEGEWPSEVGAILFGTMVGIPTTYETLNFFPPLSLRGETGSVPISGAGWGNRNLVANIEVVANRTTECLQKWQLETYTAIMNAYHKALMDYEERVAAAQISEGEAIGSSNPDINREIENQELKRSCLTLWAGQSFNNPAGIDHKPNATPPANYPEINIAHATANATEIEFFEHAFDWKNMTYEFLPYFWGRKSQWLDILSLKSTDPLFEQFLKAGGTRVVVPVDPAYVEAVLWYQLTGTIWPGGAAPTPHLIFDYLDYYKGKLSALSPEFSALIPEIELYNDYLDDLADMTEISNIDDQDIKILPDDKTTWEIKVPTTLVWLQNDKKENQLPNFEE